MEPDDRPLLHEPDLMLALLRAAAAGPATIDDALARLRVWLAEAHEGAAAADRDLRAWLEEAAGKLRLARLIEPVAAEPAASGRFQLSGAGHQVLLEHPDGVDESVLMQFEAYRAAIAHTATAHRPGGPFSPAFEAGLLAYGAGLALTDNPNAPDTGAHLEWANGWSEARDEASKRGG